MGWWIRAGWLLLGMLLVLATLVAGPAAAREVIDINPARQPVSLQNHGEAWVDPTAEAQVDNVASDRAIRWQPTSEGAIYPLDRGKALWIRFTLPPQADVERWYLEVPYPSVNKVTLYSVDVTGEWIPQSAGDTVPVAEWPVPHRHPLLPLAGVGREPRTYMLRVENGHSFSAPLQFVSESYLSRSEQGTSLVLGMYFGLAALAVLLAIVGAVSLRDVPYALYAATVALMGLTQAAITGLAGLHLWPTWPRWNDVSSLVLPVLAVGAVQWFFSEVASIRQRAPLLHWSLVALALAAVPVAIGIALVDPSHRFKLMVPYIVVASNLGLVALVWATLRGDRYAPWVLAGSLPVAIGAAFPLARTAGLIPVSFWTMHGMQIGIAFELPILLVMLMLRSQQRREHARRIQGLDRIDPATGLINANVFHERLVRLIARSQRLKIRSAILLVEIANIEQIRRTFGNEAAKELPLRVAGRLLSVARDIDSVARLSDHRFGVLLEGPLKAGEVAEAGPRIVARCLMPFKNRPLEWTAQVQVAQGLIPMDGNDPDQLIGQLEMLLASAAPDPKRTVLMLGRPPVAQPVAATS